MSKFNIFTLFLTVIIVVIVGELLVNDYVDYPALKKEITSNILGAGSDQKNADNSGDDPDTHVAPQKINFDLDGVDPQPVATSPAPSLVTKNSTTPAPTPQNPLLADDSSTDGAISPSITFGTIERVGFKNVTLQRVPFNGILFERVDMRDFKSVPVIQQNLLQHNRDVAAGFYEFHAESKLLANEIYLLLKEKIGTGPGVGVNETNEFQDGSFYINYSDLPRTAFLVVKINESVYALTYRKELHAFISSLLQLL